MKNPDYVGIHAYWVIKICEQKISLFLSTLADIFNNKNPSLAMGFKPTTL